MRKGMKADTKDYKCIIELQGKLVKESYPKVDIVNTFKNEADAKQYYELLMKAKKLCDM